MIQVDIVGLPDLERKALRAPAELGAALREFYWRSALVIEAKAKAKAPVDTGRLRGSIQSGVDTALVPTWGVVRASVQYAPHVEFGTRPHFPPPSALQPWARRHGFKSAWAVALAIAKRGTKPHPFMRPAAEESKGAIANWLNIVKARIEAFWGR